MIGAAIAKDAGLLLRDRGALASLFVLPMVFMGVFGAMFSDGDGSSRPRPIAVFSQGDGEPARRATTAIAESGLFELRPAQSAEQVRQMVADEDVAAGLIFPDGFDPLGSVPAELSIDLAQSPAVRGPIEGALAGLIGRSMFGDRAPQVLVPTAPPGKIEPADQVSSFQLFVPGNAVLFGFFLALTVGLSFIEERKSGTFRRLLAAPISRPLVILAKLVPYFLIGLIQMAVLFVIGVAVFGMEVAGSWLALVLLTCAVVLCATSLGLFIASFGGTERQVGAIGSICLLVMGMLGGGMVPRMVMPETMRTIGLFTPHAWALDGYYDLLIRPGTGLVEVWSQIAVVLAFAGGFALFGAIRFRFER